MKKLIAIIALIAATTTANAGYLTGSIDGILPIDQDVSNCAAAIDGAFDHYNKLIPGGVRDVSYNRQAKLGFIQMQGKTDAGTLRVTCYID